MIMLKSEILDLQPPILFKDSPPMLLIRQLWVRLVRDVFLKYLSPFI